MTGTRRWLNKYQLFTIIHYPCFKNSYMKYNITWSLKKENKETKEGQGPKCFKQWFITTIKSYIICNKHEIFATVSLEKYQSINHTSYSLEITNLIFNYLSILIGLPGRRQIFKIIFFVITSLHSFPNQWTLNSLIMECQPMIQYTKHQQ